MKLPYKFTLLTLVIFLILLVAISYVVFTATQGYLEKSISNQQFELAHQTIDKIDRVSEERYNDIQTIAGDRTVELVLKTASREAQPFSDLTQIKRRIKELSFISGPWDNIEIFDQKRTIIFSLNESDRGQTIKDNSQLVSLYQKALAGDVVYSDLIIDDNGNKPTVLFAAPIHDDTETDRPIIGVALGHFSWPVITDILRTTQGQTISLYNNKGFEIANKNGDFSTILKVNRSTSEIIKKGIRGSEGSEIAHSINGDYQSLSSYASEKGYLGYEGNKWFLLIETPASIAFNQAADAARQTILLLIPIIIIANTLLIVVLLRFLHPIEQLTKATEKLASGDLTQHVEIRSKDEIGQLSLAFNRMADKLQESYQNLEQKVKEKTMELAKKIGETERVNKFMVGREVKMIELKKRIEQLEAQLAKQKNSPPEDNKI